MSGVKKTAWVHVKVAPAERSAWQAMAEAEDLTLADLIRARLGAGQAVGRAPRRRPHASTADPELVAAVAKVGNNLNQLARWANSHQAAAEAVKVLTSLEIIRRQLIELGK